MKSFVFLCFQDRVSEVPTGPQPPLFDKVFNLLPLAAIDRKPENSSFGDVLQQVHPLYRQVGHTLSDTVHVPLCSSSCSVPPGPVLEPPRYSGIPQGSVLGPPVTMQRLPKLFHCFSQGDVVSVTFVAGNPRHSGDIVRAKTSIFSAVLFLFLPAVN